MAAKTSWIKGKGNQGYKVLASGKELAYLAITLPHGLGFKKGDRIFLKPMVIKGVYGVFITTERPENKKLIAN